MTWASSVGRPDERKGSGNGMILCRRQLGIVWLGKALYFVERNMPWFARRAQSMLGGDVVGHAIDPGLERATAVEPLKAAEQFAVDVLLEVAGLVRVSLHRPG